MSDFETWWHNEGSGMTPIPGEDAETHVSRVCKITWSKALLHAAEISESFDNESRHGNDMMTKQNIASEIRMIAAKEKEPLPYEDAETHCRRVCQIAWDASLASAAACIVEDGNPMVALDRINKLRGSL